VIPFGSQRAYGQDLATHLLNAQDNERLEVAQVRGAVAHDLHGAFAEWEAQAHSLTHCTNYLYSLSINPDQRQGRLTREQYLDYIERAEQRLNLSGQPRAIVFHIKQDGNGVGREHCHVIWSRIDVEQEKARHIALDHETLMMVTREFARDHGLRLPDGYNKDVVRGRRGRGYQMNLYDKRQEELGGLSLAEHKARVTAAWDRRDTARSFVRELEDMGYILATGRRDYLLVDLNGTMKALPRLIDDKKVRTADVRKFLGQDFPTNSLPSVDEARALAAGHRAAKELFIKNEERAVREAKEKQRREELQRKQQPRRQIVEQEAKALAERQRHARQEFSARQWGERAALRQSYLQESRRIRIERAANKPTGLAAFLGRISGVELITKTIHRYRDAVRQREFLARKQELAERQKREAQALERLQQLEILTMQRRMKALELVEQRERKSLETKLVKERRIEERERTDRAPPAPAKATELHKDAFNRAADKPIDLTAEFEKASGSGRADGESGGSTEQPAPESEIKVQRRKRTREREEPERSSRRTDQEGDSPSSDDPPRRRKDRDFERGL
jgi:hypothetical protein